MPSHLPFKAVLPPIFATVALNVGLYYLGISLGVFDTELPVTRKGDPLTLSPIIITSVVPVLLGWFVFLILSKSTDAPVKYFTLAATVILLLSLITPFLIPNISFEMGVWLNLMHFVVGGAVIYFFRKSAIRQGAAKE